MDKQIRISFDILQTEQTKDISKIKAAYHELLRSVNPEDDPQGFKRLRAAYEAAVAYAKTTDASDNDISRSEPEEDSPVGRFLARFEQIYASLPRRLDTKEWEALLEDPVLESLEEGENAKWRLFERFLKNTVFPPKFGSFWTAISLSASTEGSLRSIFRSALLNI